MSTTRLNKVLFLRTWFYAYLRLVDKMSTNLFFWMRTSSVSNGQNNRLKNRIAFSNGMIREKSRVFAVYVRTEACKNAHFALYLSGKVQYCII